MSKKLTEYLALTPLEFYRKTRLDLCRIAGCQAGGLSQIFTDDSSTVVFTGTGTQDDPLVATATGTAVDSFYAQDGTLVGDRTVSGGSNILVFNDLTNFEIQTNPNILLSNSINTLLFNAGGACMVGKMGFGFSTAPAATIHIAAGNAGAESAPIKINPGTLMTAPEDGSIEYDGTALWFTVGESRKNISDAGSGFGVPVLHTNVTDITLNAASPVVHLIDTTGVGSTVVVNLPDNLDGTLSGKLFIIKKIAGSQGVSIDGGEANIDGVASQGLSNAQSSIYIIFDGTNYHIISRMGT